MLAGGRDVEREQLLGMLVVLLCAPTLLGCACLPLRTDDLPSGRAMEQRAWRALWLPLFPAAFAAAFLIGWAASGSFGIAAHAGNAASATLSSLAGVWRRQPAAELGRRWGLATHGLRWGLTPQPRGKTRRCCHPTERCQSFAPRASPQPSRIRVCQARSYDPAQFLLRHAARERAGQLPHEDPGSTAGAIRLR
jgi:hypothetical protein